MNLVIFGRIKAMSGQRGMRGLAIAIALSAVAVVAQTPRAAFAQDVDLAIGLGILGGEIAGAAIAGAAANPYYAPPYNPYGYAPPAPAYYPPAAAPYYPPPRNCWDPYYRRYYQC